MSTNQLILTRRQFEALAYGWEMLSTADNKDMLQLVQMGLLYPPWTPSDGMWLFKLTDAGIEMCERLHGGNVRVVLTEEAK